MQFFVVITSKDASQDTLSINNIQPAQFGNYIYKQEALPTARACVTYCHVQERDMCHFTIHLSGQCYLGTFFLSITPISHGLFASQAILGYACK